MSCTPSTWLRHTSWLLLPALALQACTHQTPHTSPATVTDLSSPSPGNSASDESDWSGPSLLLLRNQGPQGLPQNRQGPPVWLARTTPLGPAQLATRSWWSCGTRLLTRAGVPEQYQASALTTYYQAGLRDLTGPQAELALSLMYVESRYEVGAVSAAPAYGLMQVTQIAADEASKQCGLPRRRATEFARSATLAVRYGTCYLSHLLTLEGGSEERASRRYNAGVPIRGVPATTEAREYWPRVSEALTYCRTGSTTMQQLTHQGVVWTEGKQKHMQLVMSGRRTHRAGTWYTGVRWAPPGVST